MGRNRIDSTSPPVPGIRVWGSARQWWKNIAGREGYVEASRQLLVALWDFVRDSTPERRRQRYGDVDYDWEHRVNTTGAAIGWRNRLLGVFHSPYQPTEPALFHEMLNALREQSHADFRDLVFIDLGSGKGRTLMMASDYPFRRIVGVELLPELHEAARENLKNYRSDSQKCFALESICADATEFIFPAEPFVLYLFNPLPEAGLRRVITNLEQSVQTHPRRVYVIYHNPLLERVLSANGLWKQLFRTHQFAIYD